MIETGQSEIKHPKHPIRVMLDLETFGNRPGSVITSIGAVAFTTGLGKEFYLETGSFYMKVKPQSCIDVGLKMDADTIFWWLKQSDQARLELADMDKAYTLGFALARFELWLGEQANEKTEIWGNGSDFDNQVLAAGYHACGMEVPWQFWNNRCYRTLKNMFPGTKVGREGTHHNALDDARYQARHLMAILTLDVFGVGMNEKMSDRVRIDGDMLRVRFGPAYDTEAYRLFLKSKEIPEAQVEYDEGADTYQISAPSRFAPILGVEDLKKLTYHINNNPDLWDSQQFVVGQALEAKRYAVWADCGRGKTLIYLEWARHVRRITGRKVLILAPSGNLQRQIVQECGKFYPEEIPLKRIETRQELMEWCRDGGNDWGITNFEKMIQGTMEELRWLGGVVIDESSILKTGGGVIKWNIIKSCRGIEYKLSCTATPAPNDTMEYASQASFLEKLRHEGEILWTFFGKDKAGNWQVKPHAREAFFQFMSSWSIYLRDPKTYGFKDTMADVPPPVMREVDVPMTGEQGRILSAQMIQDGSGLLENERMSLSTRNILSQTAKGFRYRKEGGTRKVDPVESEKPWVIAETVKAEVAAGGRVLIWTVYDEESRLIAKAMEDAGVKGFETLHGSHKPADRYSIIEQFSAGDTAVLISKARLLGLGMNFPFCTMMVFSGWNDSYEQFYQAIRRAYRPGQKNALKVVVPIVRELEGLVWENVLEKGRRFEEEAAMCERHYAQANGLLNTETKKEA